MAFSVATNFGTTGTRLTTGGDSTTGWSGGGAEPDFFYQGSNSYSVLVKTSENEVEYTHASTVDFTTGRLVANVKIIQTNKDALAGDGVQVWIGNDSSNAYSWRVFTASTYPIPGGFQIVCIDPQVSAVDTRYTEGTAPTMTTIDYFRFASQCNATAKSQNFAADAIDVIENGYGLLGTGTSPDGTFDDFRSYDEDTSTNRYGIVQSRGGILYINGVIKIGSSGTATTFDDANTVVVFPHHRVTTGFCGIDFDIQNASSAFTITNCMFNGRGALYTSDDTRPDYEIIGSSGTVDFVGCTFNNYRLITLNASVSATSCAFIAGGTAIIGDGADLSNSTISEYAGTAGTSALEWDYNHSGSGKFDGMTFIKSASIDHHAIEFGTSAPTTITLTNVTFTDFSTSNGVNGSVLYFPDKGTDTTWTVNCSGVTGTVSYYKARSGDTVNVVNSVTVTLTGLVNPTEVRVYTQDSYGLNDTEIDGVESETSGTWAFSYTASETVNIVIYSTGYLPADIYDYTIPSSAASIPIQQIFDRQYYNP